MLIIHSMHCWTHLSLNQVLFIHLIVIWCLESRISHIKHQCLTGNWQIFPFCGSGFMSYWKKWKLHLPSLQWELGHGFVSWRTPKMRLRWTAYLPLAFCSLLVRHLPHPYPDALPRFLMAPECCSLGFLPLQLDSESNHVLQRLKKELVNIPHIIQVDFH